jgi:very-short-patch-repair endonuclease
LNGFKFVRQEPIGAYFADFACRELKLVVELDGSQHAEDPRDSRRTEFMNAQGWSVARFWSDDVLAEKDTVMDTVLAVCEGRITEAVISRDFSFFPARTLIL